jgi:hypothetical protein
MFKVCLLYLVINMGVSSNIFFLNTNNWQIFVYILIFAFLYSRWEDKMFWSEW